MDNPEIREALQPIFEYYGVDLVLQGHDHTYARSGLMTHENVGTGVTARSPKAGTVYVVSVSGPKMPTISATSTPQMAVPPGIQYFSETGRITRTTRAP